jgi:hypothetical protein
VFLHRILAVEAEMLPDFLLRGTNPKLFLLIEKELIDLILPLSEPHAHSY